MQNITLAPALVSSLYTAVSINNAFDSDLNPLIGFLDSHVSN